MPEKTMPDVAEPKLTFPTEPKPVPNSVDPLLTLAAEREASDLHLTMGVSPTLRIHGKLVPTEYAKLTGEDTKQLVFGILNDHQKKILEERWDLDCSYNIKNVGRFRVNLYKQRGTYGGAFRMIPNKIPSREELSLPPILDQLVKKSNGLILITGATGQGKSTTLACLINMINSECQEHIITIEDPIEFAFSHKLSLVNQREVGGDTQSWAVALRAALREDPNVLMVGEMRDPETIAATLTAAETGHLVFSTLHTMDAVQTVDRIIDVFHPHQQQQVRIQLASVLQAILSLQLIPTVNGNGRVPAVEVLVPTPAIRSLIREGKSHQIYTNLQTGLKFGMQTMDRALFKLYQDKKIAAEECLNRALNPDEMKRLLNIPET